MSRTRAELQSGSFSGAVLSRRLLPSITLAILLILVIIVAIGLGSVSLPLLDVGRALLNKGATPMVRDIVLLLRAPRVAVAGLVGAALATSGAAMQGLFRNPMADPGIIGVSAGGAMGGVLAFALGLYRLSIYALPGLAFLGALTAVAAVQLVAGAVGRRSTMALLLTGMALAAMFSAVTSLLITVTVSNQDVLREIVFWLTGGLEARSWIHAQIIVPAIAIGLAWLFTKARALNLMTLGDDEARSLGVDPGPTRRWVLFAAALATGAAVSVSGIIGFVGLIVPHMLRLWIGSDLRVLLPNCALGGAAFLILADALGRVAYGAVEIRVGIITALFGAPFFLYLVYRHGRTLMAGE